MANPSGERPTAIWLPSLRFDSCIIVLLGMARPAVGLSDAQRGKWRKGFGMHRDQSVQYFITDQTGDTLGLLCQKNAQRQGSGGIIGRSIPLESLEHHAWPFGDVH